MDEKIDELHRLMYESERYLKVIIESSIDGILVVDDQGRFEFGNEAVFSIFGWPKDELIGQFFMKIIPEDLTDFMLERWTEVQNGIDRPYETKIITKNGEIRHLHVSHSRTMIQGKRKYVVVITDITENKKLQKYLEESEAKYKDLFENAEDPMYTIDNQGFIRTINKSGIKILGGDDEEIIGSHISRWLTSESLKSSMDILAKQMSGECLEETVLIEVITKGGEHKWGESKTRILKDGDTITGVHGIVRDITQKIKLEQQLRESESMYRDLFDNASDCFYTIDLNGQFLSVNDALVKSMECSSRDEVLESNMSRWMTEESLEKAYKFMNEVITEEDYYNKSVVIEIIRKDGGHVWFEHKARPIKDNNGNIIGLHGIGRDITEKKKMEQELKESEAKYRDLFDNAQDAMYVLNKEAIVLKMNQIGLEILGRTINEVIGKSIVKWLTPESIKIVEGRMKKRLAGEPLSRIDEIEIIGKNGEHRWIEIKTRPILENGKLIEIHGIGRDITENKKLKQKLNNSNKQRKLLCYLIKGTRGGETRALILKYLSENSYNANQLSNILKMDYKTVRYHLSILIKNNIINMDKKGNSSAIYFISGKVSADMTDL